MEKEYHVFNVFDTDMSLLYTVIDYNGEITVIYPSADSEE